MPNLKDIRRRIDSVQKTQQITSAMRMVAAAKLRRAQEAILAARPYAERMAGTLAEVGGAEAEHPLLEAHEQVKRIEFVVIASDRGLCGAFNSAVLKAADAAIAAREEQIEDVALTLVGRKAGEYFRRRRPASIAKTFSGIARVEYAHATAIAVHLTERYLAGEIDEVVLVFSEFVSAMTQTPRVVQLLPVTPDAAAEGEADEAPFDIEPSPEKLLQVLVPKALEIQIYRALLECQAGEHAARMAAMESATRNTEEMIDSLTLQYNRARQAAITKELVEIVSGAEAL